MSVRARSAPRPHHGLLWSHACTSRRQPVGPAGSLARRGVGQGDSWLAGGLWGAGCTRANASLSSALPARAAGRPAAAQSGAGVGGPRQGGGRGRSRAGPGRGRGRGRNAPVLLRAVGLAVGCPQRPLLRPVRGSQLQRAGAGEGRLRRGRALERRAGGEGG